MRPLFIALILLAPVLALSLATAPARAEGHGVTIRNGGGESIRGIYFGGASESRLRHDLPQGAEARIGFNSGCRTDIRIAYASGRTEDHPGVEVCTDPRIVAGQDGVAGPPMAALPPNSSPAPVGTAGKAATKVTATTQPVKAPPPVVPPWTGKSITKRFGGMD